MKTGIFDLHCDTLSALYGERLLGRRVTFAVNARQVDVQKMRAGGYVAQVFAAFVHPAHTADAYTEILAQIALYERLTAQNPDMLPVRTGADLCRARAAGGIAALLAVEDAGVTNGQMERVYALCEQGVRLMTLTWNFQNTLAAPNDVPNGMVRDADRLTCYGVEVVRELERLGVAIDVSHLSDGAAYDVLRHTACPVLASHSCARSVCGHVRNVSDDFIYQIGKRGGVIGLNFYDVFLCGKEGGADLSDFVRHARHIVNVGGEDVLALGSDFDGIPTSRALPDASYLPCLLDALSQAGFTARQVEKIANGNAFRFFENVLH